MSSSIWESCNGAEQICSVSGRVFRLVESQEQVATLGYVDTLDEQAILENLLETVKPKNLPEAEPYHYLLKTPFRYPPLKWGSRFGRQHESGIFYGGASVNVTLAESAYYRFVFWYSIDAEAPKPNIQSEHTLFSVRYRSEFGIQLQLPPFDAEAARLRDVQQYSATQTLGTAMRDAGVQVVEYSSARDPDSGICIGIYTPKALARKQPESRNKWLCELTKNEVVFKNLDLGDLHRFSFESFCHAGELPLPA